jgi:hypothetical protein
MVGFLIAYATTVVWLVYMLAVASSMALCVAVLPVALWATALIWSMLGSRGVTPCR